MIGAGPQSRRASRSDFWRRQRRGVLALTATWWLFAFGCVDSDSRTSLARTAQFGVFFGGQVQERSSIPFELDPTKQQYGFRIELTQPLGEDLRLSWELSVPSSQAQVRDIHGRRGRGRMTRLGRAIVRAGETRFDHVMRFQPGEPLGVWNIRVVANDEILIDRPFEVYDRAQRRRALRAADAGP